MCPPLAQILLTYFTLVFHPTARAVFLVRPFLSKPIRIDTPKHNFWPYVPVSDPERGENETYFKKPDHNFWPYIPVKTPDWGNSSYFDVPRHNFWPFIPVVPPGKNGTKPVPVTPPRPIPTLPGPENGYDYGEVIYKSILFYEAQRSGWLPDDRKVTWRGHSALEDRGEYGEDLTGGWYDAGDYVKFGFPMAGATSMLLLGLIEFRDAYQSVNLLQEMYDCVRWPLDYFMKAHTSQYEFYAQVADPYVDHSYWGRPEDMTMYRPAYKLSPEAPGSDVIGETAAALAAGAIAFRSVDKDYSNQLLRHASELFEFADRYRGLYSDSLPIVQEFYSSSGYNDELAWAAAWLYKATGDKRYLQQAEDNYVSTECWAVSWDAKDCLAAVLLYKLTGKDEYRLDIERTLNSWMPGGSVDYTPGGLAFRTPWGPLRYTANMAGLALIAANAGIQPLAYRKWARDQIHYMLGDSGRSFLIGFGDDSPVRPHHAASSCPPYPSECTWAHYTTSSPNPITLYGALVGGPAIDDSFYDARDDYYQNEVTCDYNSGFQTAVAGLVQLELQRKQLERISEMEGVSGPRFAPSATKISWGRVWDEVPPNFANNFPTDQRLRKKPSSSNQQQGNARLDNLQNNNQKSFHRNNPNNFPSNTIQQSFSEDIRLGFPRNNRNNSSSFLRRVKQRGKKVENLQKMDRETQRKTWGGLLQSFKPKNLREYRSRREQAQLSPHRQQNLPKGYWQPQHPQQQQQLHQHQQQQQRNLQYFNNSHHRQEQRPTASALSLQSVQHGPNQQQGFYNYKVNQNGQRTNTNQRQYHPSAQRQVRNQTQPSAKWQPRNKWQQNTKWQPNIPRKANAEWQPNAKGQPGTRWQQNSKWQQNPNLQSSTQRQTGATWQPSSTWQPSTKGQQITKWQPTTRRQPSTRWQPTPTWRQGTTWQPRTKLQPSTQWQSNTNWRRKTPEPPNSQRQYSTHRPGFTQQERNPRMQKDRYVSMRRQNDEGQEEVTKRRKQRKLQNAKLQRKLQSTVSPSKQTTSSQQSVNNSFEKATTTGSLPQKISTMRPISQKTSMDTQPLQNNSTMDFLSRNISTKNPSLDNSPTMDSLLQNSSTENPLLRGNSTMDALLQSISTVKPSAKKRSTLGSLVHNTSSPTSPNISTISPSAQKTLAPNSVAMSRNGRVKLSQAASKTIRRQRSSGGGQIRNPYLQQRRFLRRFQPSRQNKVIRPSQQRSFVLQKQKIRRVQQNETRINENLVIKSSDLRQHQTSDIKNSAPKQSESLDTTPSSPKQSHTSDIKPSATKQSKTVDVKPSDPKQSVRKQSIPRSPFSPPRHLRQRVPSSNRESMKTHRQRVKLRRQKLRQSLQRKSQSSSTSQSTQSTQRVPSTTHAPLQSTKLPQGNTETEQDTDRAPSLSQIELQNSVKQQKSLSPFTPFKSKREQSVGSSLFRGMKPGTGSGSVLQRGFFEERVWNPDIGQSGQSGLRQSGFERR